jgi:hypothetical protein
MGLYVNQKNSRTELQERLAAELREKAKKRAENDDLERPDGVTDSEYLRQTKQTTSLAWAWILIAIAAIALIVWLTIQTTTTA